MISSISVKSIEILIGLIEMILSSSMPTLVLILVSIGVTIWWLSKDAETKKAIRSKIVDFIQSSLVRISTHPLLHSQTKYLRVVDSLDFDDPQRTKILKAMFAIIVKQITKWARATQNKAKEDFYLKAVMFESLADAITEYEKEILKWCIKEYGKEDGAAIYELVYIQNVKGYNKNMLDMVFAVIEHNTHSKLKPRVKIYSIFTMMLSMLDTSLINLERTFRELNGALSSITNKHKI